MSTRLRELIRSIRRAKTAAEERAVVARESADIRTALKDKGNSYKARNVAKLMYIHMLGHSADYGQMACLELISSQSYTDKRVGYLAMSVLFDENVQLLTLVENCLRKDMHDRSLYTQGLALTCLANISSADMLQDLYPDVEELLSHSNPYVKKKAVICALRIVRKVPDLSESIIDKVPLLLTDRNHGVLVATVQLATTLALQEPSSFSYIQKTIPILIRLMKTLLMSTYGVEHDVAGIADPFLQVKAIRLLRILLQKSDTVPPEVVELLTQVTTNTEGRKNAGHAILYECCFTIISLNVPAVLRNAAINMIGRFLAHRDPNLRYVALYTLAQIPEEDLPSIRRYHETIVQCLRYPDPSLRRRSLDLISSLVNAENAQKLVPELIHYLSSGDDDFREDLCEKLSTVIERFAPNPQWQVDMMSQVIKMAGNFVSKRSLLNLLVLISSKPDLQPYVVHRMFTLLLDVRIQPKLAQLCSWVVGEYGIHLTDPPIPSKEGEPRLPKVSEDEIVHVLEEILTSTTNELTKHVLLMALGKLAARFESQKRRIRKILESYGKSHSVELQTRSVEFSRLVEKDLLNGIFKPMPRFSGDGVEEDFSLDSAQNASKEQETTTTVVTNDLDDILMGLGASTMPTPSSSGVPDIGIDATTLPKETPLASGGSSSSFVDDILGLTGPSVAPHPESKTLTQESNLDPFLADILGGSSQHSPPPLVETKESTAPPLQPSGPPTPPITHPMTSMVESIEPSHPSLKDETSHPTTASDTSNVVFKDDLFVITGDFKKKPDDVSMSAIKLYLKTTSSVALENVKLLIAVPKYLRLSLRPPSGNTLQPHQENGIEQDVILQNSQHGVKRIVLRMKLSWSEGSVNKERILTLSDFPAGY